MYPVPYPACLYYSTERRTCQYIKYGNQYFRKNLTRKGDTELGTLYENIIALCEEKGIKGGKMCTDIGMSKGILTDLKMGRQTGISAVNAQKIASYFGVSVGFLLGEESNEKKEPIAVADDELEEDVIIFHRDGKTQRRKFTKEQMAMFMAMVDAIPETPKDDI